MKLVAEVVNKMADCDECRYYYYEKDTNFSDCRKDEEGKYWFTHLECPSFKSNEPDPDKEHDEREE